MNVDDCAAPIQFLPDGLERGMPKVYAFVVAHEYHAINLQLIEGATNLGERCVHVGERQRGEEAKAVGASLYQVRPVVVHAARHVRSLLAGPTFNRGRGK